MPAQAARPDYPRAVDTGGDRMLGWLAHVCCTRRVESQRKQVHVAASLGVDQRTIGRFEAAEAWPRDADLVVAAYADDLEIDARDIWAQALALWQSDGRSPDLQDLLRR